MTATDRGSFRAVARVSGGRAVVEVTGEVDARSCVQLEHLFTAVLADAPDELALDLAGVTFLDSSGLRSLLRAHDLGRSRRVAVRVVRASTTVHRVLEWTGLDHVLGLDHVPGADDAAGEVRPDAGREPTGDGGPGR